MAGSKSARGPDGLTERERRFVALYLSNGQNATHAYQALSPAASFNTAKRNGHDLFHRPAVQAALAKAIGKATEKLEISAERVLQEFARIAFSDIQDVVHIDENGVPVIDLTKAKTSGKTAVIAEITQDEYTEGRGDDARAVKRTKVKFHDKLAALNALAKNLGLLKEQIELTGDLNVRQMTDEQLQARLAQLLRKGRAAGDR